jgi:hypothetical protein
MIAIDRGDLAILDENHQLNVSPMRVTDEVL